MLIKKTCPNFGVKEHSQKSFRNQTSVNIEQYHEVSGVANLRENLALSGILETKRKENLQIKLAFSHI